MIRDLPAKDADRGGLARAVLQRELRQPVRNLGSRERAGDLGPASRSLGLGALASPGGYPDSRAALDGTARKMEPLLRHQSPTPPAARRHAQCGLFMPREVRACGPCVTTARPAGRRRPPPRMAAPTKGCGAVAAAAQRVLRKDHLGDGRIAQAGIGAALIGHLDLQGVRARIEAGVGRSGLHLLPIDLLIAEVGIDLDMPWRQVGCRERQRSGLSALISILCRYR